MANMHLVTGYAGQEHVTSADHGAFNTAIFGNGQFVLGKGNKLSASVQTNNSVRVLDGDIYMQGRYIRLNESNYIDLTIENGEQGKNRNDLIVARYTKDNITSVEEVSLAVIKGTSTTDNAVDPSYTSGDLISNHDALNEMPLYRIPISGLNVGDPVRLFTLYDQTMIDKLDTLNRLTVESTISDGDYFPMYDISASADRKVQWSRIKEIIKDSIIPSVVSDSNSTYTVSTLADNTVYHLGTLTALTISAFPESGHYHANISFTAGTSCTVAVPSGAKWIGGSAPTITAGRLYELDIRDGKITVGEFY